MFCFFISFIILISIISVRGAAAAEAPELVRAPADAAGRGAKSAGPGRHADPEGPVGATQDWVFERGERKEKRKVTTGGI